MPSMISSRAKLLVKPIFVCSRTNPLGTQPAKAAVSSKLTSALRSRGYHTFNAISLRCNVESLRVEKRYLKTRRSLKRSNITEMSNADDSSDAIINTHQANWDIMFDVLKEYRAQHGDTLVPAMYPDNPPLGKWVDNQRQSYRMSLETEDVEKSNAWGSRTITDDRVEKLNSIDFIWNIYEHIWNVRYEELKAYIAEHGNSLVPYEYSQNEALGIWVAKQRRMFKIRQQGERTYELHDGTVLSEVILSEERSKKLNDVGFVWDVHEAQWLERLEELRVYRLNHGDTLVPKQHPLLGRRVDKQRFDYKRYMAKKRIEAEWGDNEITDEKVKKEVEMIKRKSTGMTEERIRLLNAEDFIWEPQAYAWESRFTELCNFLAMNGHAAIYRRIDSNDALSRWVESQRINYRKYKNGVKSGMTEERIAKLDSINFTWERMTKRRSYKKDEKCDEADMESAKISGVNLSQSLQ